MKFFRKYINDKEFLFLALLITQFVFFITFTRYYFFSINKNSDFIFYPYTFIAIIVTIYILLFIKSDFRFKEIKKFYLSHAKLIKIALLIIFLYNLSFFYADYSNQIKVNLVNFFFKNFNFIIDYVSRNTVIFFLTFFIFNLYLVWKLKLKDTNVINILLNFSKFFLFLSIINLILYLLSYKTDYIKIYHLFSDLENCLYFQFLPIGADSKRNYEIIPFLFGYVLTLNLNQICIV